MRTGRAAAPRLDPGGEEFRLDPADEPVVAGDADDVVHAVVLAPGHDLLADVGGVGPHQDPEPRPPAAELADDAGELVERARGGVGVAGPEHGAQRVRAAEDVERQQAVVAVVAVEGVALLAAVHPVIRRVDVEHEPRGGQPSRPGLDEEVGEERLKRLGVVGDPVIAPRLPVPGRMLEAVQRALARQRRAALAPSTELVGQQRQQRVVAQGVVIVEVLVAQREARDPLSHQGPDRVLRQTRIAPVRETGGHPVEQPDAPVGLPQQQGSPVRSDRAAIERGRSPSGPGTLEIRTKLGLHLCRHRFSAVVTVKSMRHINLTVTGGRCHPIAVRNPG